jgi:isoleucyl-tRNA synthetase
MLGHDSNYVPGWDCHGLPIEWKIEEEYMAKGKAKPNLKDPVAMTAFRAECRAFAEKWLNVQREEFKRLGVEGDWAHPYTTMSFPAEATIARELMTFAKTGQLYRGSKPVMWSVVEKTALAEAEVEYHDYQSDMVWVKFPVTPTLLHTTPRGASSEEVRRINPPQELAGAHIVIWTTTPWTIPGNRAISFNSKLRYCLYEVTASPAGNWAQVGERLVLAHNLADQVMKAAKVEAYTPIADVSADALASTVCHHPLYDAGFRGYDFAVPLLDGDHVTDDAGTGFVHTAPGHGREDFDIWTASTRLLQSRGIDPAIPYTVDENGAFTKDAPGFEGKRVINDKGEKGDANQAVIDALVKAGNLLARGRLKHQYPHSWRSKKPVIFRNTPQWFIHMDKEIPYLEKLSRELHAKAAGSSGAGHNQPIPKSLREVSLQSIRDTEWVPKSGENRITGMIEAKPDWVISRQRAWGVPIAVFVRKSSGEVLVDDKVNQRIYDAMYAEGADAWFSDADGARFLKPDFDPADFEKVNDVLDVWFDSGSTHSYVLNDPHFPSLTGIERQVDGGRDRVMYLEGSDQHRGWFHSSLIESSGTRGRAPFDVVLTHGFCLDEKGQKMSKSVGNVTAPQDVIKNSGADILRLWVAASDYSDDLRIGPEILKNFVETYRKMRNTLRWMLGTLAHYKPEQEAAVADMPELERYMLHQLTELDVLVRKAYAEYDYKRVVSMLAQFMNTELSAFYFDIRKDALYCDAPSSQRRRAALSCVEHILRCVTTWLAPIIVFTAEEAWLARYPSEDGSVHVETFIDIPAAWRADGELIDNWEVYRNVRRVVTGALEIERAAKRIGSSLEAAPIIHVSNLAAYKDFVAHNVDFAELCITSAVTLVAGDGPADAFRLPSIPDIAVVPGRAEGRKCARSWRITTDVGSDPAYPELSARDAAAMREIEAA